MEESLEGVDVDIAKSENKGEEGKRAKQATSQESRLCRECGSPNLSYDHVRAEVFCKKCGFVIEETIMDEGPEWSSYSHEENQRLSRVGPPIKRGTLNSQLTTIIPSSRVDSRGTPMSPRAMKLYYHLGRLQRQVAKSGKGERSIGPVSRALNRLASQLQLPPAVVEEASFVSMKAIKSDLLRGRSVQSLVAASLYIACRNLSIPRTLDEITRISGVGRKRLTKTISVVSRKLGFKPKPVTPSDYIARFCSELELGDDVRVLAGNILSRAGEENSLSPPGTAASAIYLAAIAKGQRVPQKRIAKVAGVSEVTLRSHFKLFRDIISVEVPRGRVSPSSNRSLRAATSSIQATNA
ncbi:MAG: transcription initiation factor IIB family protein [Candidatus Hodarchaeota archaeon]